VSIVCIVGPRQLLVAMRTLKDMVFGKRSERLAAIVAEQFALEPDDLATGVMPSAPANDDAPVAKPPGKPRQKARGATSARVPVLLARLQTGLPWA
jgi:transposase